MTKVALTGTSNCGKTMFLTSLLWQLEEFDETRFRLRDGITIRGFNPLSVRKGETAFPFKRFRNMLAHEYKWPAKTKDVYHYPMCVPSQRLVANLGLAVGRIPRPARRAHCGRRHGGARRLRGVV